MITFGGLASGLDTESLISQLTSLQRARATPISQKQSASKRQSAIITDLVTKLSSLRSKARELDSPTEIRTLKASSSDSAKVAITASGSASAATHQIKVTTLAKAQSSISQTFATSGAGAVGAGTLGIKVGDADAVDVTFTNSDSLSDVVARINQNVAGVRASFLNTGSGYKLVVAAKETGTDHAIAFTETGSSMGFTLPTSTVTPATDAAFNIDGIDIVRHSNLVTDLVDGATISLLGAHAPTDLPAQVSIESDGDGLKSKLQSLVDSYNGVVEQVNGQLSYKGTTKGPDSLFGDSTLRGLQRRLGQITSKSWQHGTETVSMGQLGLTLGSDGKLSIDATKLANKSATDPGAIEDFLSGNNQGFAHEISALVDEYTRAGDGHLSVKTKSLSQQISRYDDDIARIQDQASHSETTLRQQFSKLEQLISSLRAQQTSLSSLF